MVAAKIATLPLGANQYGEGASKEAASQSEAAALLNVSRPSVQRARNVLEHGAPELIAVGWLRAAHGVRLLPVRAVHRKSVAAVRTDRPASVVNPRLSSTCAGGASDACRRRQAQEASLAGTRRAGDATEKRDDIRKSGGRWCVLGVLQHRGRGCNPGAVLDRGAAVTVATPVQPQATRVPTFL